MDLNQRPGDAARTAVPAFPTAARATAIAPATAGDRVIFDHTVTHLQRSCVADSAAANRRACAAAAAACPRAPRSSRTAYASDQGTRRAGAAAVTHRAGARRIAAASPRAAGQPTAPQRYGFKDQVAVGVDLNQPELRGSGVRAPGDDVVRFRES